MKHTFLPSVLLSLVCLVAPGCGDSGGGGGKADGGTDDAVECPTTAKPDNGAGLMGTCCYRKSNATDTDAPELRLSAVRLTSPKALSGDAINITLQNFLDNETFNWLVRFNGLDGDDPEYTTGFGAKDDDHTFAFRPAGDEFAPASGAGTLESENFTAGPAAQKIIVPILDADSLEPTVRFELTNLSIVKAVLSEERTCVGRRDGDRFVTTEGNLTSFITVADARDAIIDIPGLFNTSLCDLLRDKPTQEYDEASSCPDGQDEWPSPPTALCEGATCEPDPGDGSLCTPTTCNAWYLEADFAAQGVEITDTEEGDGGVDAGE